MQIDRDAFACYVSLTPSGLTVGVAKTVEVSDLVLVDVDDAGEPVGLEFVMPAAEVTDAMLTMVAVAYPQLEGAAMDDVRRAFIGVRIAAANL